MSSMFEKMFGYGGVKGVAEDTKTEIKKALPKKETVKKAGKGIGSAIEKGIRAVREYSDVYREMHPSSEYHPFGMSRPDLFGMPAKQVPERKKHPKKVKRAHAPQHHMHPKRPPQESEEQRIARERKRYDELIRKNPDINRAYALRQAQQET